MVFVIDAGTPYRMVDVMKELNWEKYKALGLVEYFEDRDGRQIGRIKDWTKRNDHRHHAMDALTVAFTKDVFIQYFNNKNASLDPNANEHAIKNKYFQNGRAIAPMPLREFRAEAKKHLENTLISIFLCSALTKKSEICSVFSTGTCISLPFMTSSDDRSKTSLISAIPAFVA